MPFVNAYPELVAAAASDLAVIGSAISTANAAAAIPTSGVLAPGADAVSAGIAALFGAHAQAYQVLSAQAVTVHDQIVQTLNAGANSYAAAEAANAAPLQAVQTAHHDLLVTRSDGPARAGLAAPVSATPVPAPAPARPVVAPARPPGRRAPG
ncbi:PE family protein [Mycobacterium riyadhense]|uniref:PE family protein n=1 Tax=Mycobacterium riyadhense TaxID=486698 RepID=UPI001956605D|nr:PE family protein [Mycobacterium riyadhense]